MLDDPDPGLLPRVPGAYIAQASHRLPPPTDDGPLTASAEIDTTSTWHGLVRVHFARERMRHGRHSRWAWVAFSAEKVA
jgi:hypothetical protein